MSLQFILGGSGTGKSACLYEMVINRSMAEPDADIILLVPEQYTMLTQRHLVRQHPRHSVLNVDVLSFERLAYRIFEETGTDCREILDDTGKSMILRRILAGHGGELHAFGGNVRKRGFTDQVKSMLSELLQYGVDPALLQEKGAALAPESRLFAKIRDISLIYTHFLDFIGDRYMTTEQVLDRLCTVIGKSDRMKKAVIYMDNFTGFTPVQLKVMEKILQICPEVAMTLCADTDDLSFSPDQPDKDELFYITKETIWRMDEICRQYRIPRGKDILLGKDGQARFADRPDLSVLHFDGQPSEVLLFRLTGIAEQGYYIVKRRILSSESGSILDEWENFQFSEDLTADDVRYLRERCIPQIRMQKLYVGDNEELSFEVEMRPEDVVLLHIYRE